MVCGVIPDIKAPVRSFHGSASLRSVGIGWVGPAHLELDWLGSDWLGIGLPGTGLAGIGLLGTGLLGPVYYA